MAELLFEFLGRHCLPALFGDDLVDRLRFLTAGWNLMPPRLSGMASYSRRSISTRSPIFKSDFFGVTAVAPNGTPAG